MKNGKYFWGPFFWTLIHTITLYNRNRIDTIKFINILPKVLPCDVCRYNMYKKLISLPINNYSDNNQSLFYFSYLLHNLVNSQLNRSSPSFSKVRDTYIKGIKHYGNGFWYEIMWHVIHIIAITTDKNEIYAKETIFLISKCIPNRFIGELMFNFMSSYPMSRYLRNNHDLFFYTYIFHDNINRMLNIKRLPEYNTFKEFYLLSLGSECASCKI